MADKPCKGKTVVTGKRAVLTESSSADELRDEIEQGLPCVPRRNARGEVQLWEGSRREACTRRSIPSQEEEEKA